MTQTETVETVETIEARIERLCGGLEIGPKRTVCLGIAHAAGMSDDDFVAIASARRLAAGRTIILPAHRFEGLSRGRGWARQGKGASATWGERENGDYRVGPGTWEVGATDGFSRKQSDRWRVQHVGAFTIAN